MRAAAQASITGTIATGILSSVRRKKAGRRRYRVASEDLRRGQKQQEKRDHAPDCRPMLHWSDVFYTGTPDQRMRTLRFGPRTVPPGPTPMKSEEPAALRIPARNTAREGIFCKQPASPDRLKTDGRRYSPLMKIISPSSTAMHPRCARRLEQNPVRRIA